MSSKLVYFIRSSFCYTFLLFRYLDYEVDGLISLLYLGEMTKFSY